jgi:hypothetical protein
MDKNTAILDEIIERVHDLPSDLQEDMLGILRTWQENKKRKYQRLNQRTEIDVVVGDRVIQTDTKDISATGIFINTSGKFEAEKSVRVVFSVPGIEKPFKLKGLIVRVEQSGMAIKFEEITPYFKAMLDDIIWQKNMEL